VWWPWSIVAAAVGWNLVNLRSLTLNVAYFNDSTLHEQMVRFATARLRAGHLPLTSWSPFLGEGSPQFLHYQSLPAILTGLAGLATGPDAVFRWSTAGAELDRLVAVIGRGGDGRTYAGMPSNWGQDFTVGSVPVFKYLESRDVDEVGYTLRTASLMTGPEYYFDDRNASDYRLFGIRYLILPARTQPPVPARLTMRSGPYWLWTISGGGYVQAGRIVGEISADRTNVATRAIPLLRSGLAADDTYLGVRYGSSGGQGPLPTVPSPSPLGQVSAETTDLDDGQATATVRMSEPGVAVLSASYDPGWTATVNGRPQPTRMVAPALVVVAVPAGTDHVVFRYHGYGDYPALLTLSGLTLVIVAVGPACVGYARRRRDARGSRYT
jgi:hypothetical protein